MSFLDRNFNQAATYWATTGVDNSGDPIWAAAVSIQVRWEDKNRTFTNASGEETQASSIVFVKQDMAAGDFLFLGTSTSADPTTVSGAKEVQGFEKIPQLVGIDFERKVLL